MPKSFANAYALLVAVDEHSEPQAVLPHLARDVASLRAALEDPLRAGYAESHVRVLRGKSAQRAKILNGLSWLQERASIDRGATMLVYFGGHGLIQNNVHYLVPFDAKVAAARQAALAVITFCEELDALSGANVFVVIDGCHAGGMGVKGRAPYPSESIPAALLQATANSRNASRVVLSSSQQDEKSYLERDGQISIFMHHLIDSLSGFAGGARAEFVLASEVIAYVCRRVPEASRAEWNGMQIPDVAVHGDFPLALMPPRDIPAPRPDLRRPHRSQR